MNAENDSPNDDAARTGPAEVAPDLTEEALGPQMDNIVPSYGYDMTPMVGLGGSAGSAREPPLQNGRVFARASVA
jgi:hypothetical protein